MKHNFLWLFLRLAVCLISPQLYAQSSQQVKIDSMLKLLHQVKEDQRKVDMMLDLLNYYETYKPKEGFQYTIPCIRLADKLQYKKGMINARIRTGRLYWKVTQFDEAIRYHQEALDLAAQFKDQQGIFNATVSLGQDYADGDNYSKALVYFNKLVELAKSSGDKDGLSTAYNLISWIYTQQGNYPKSAEYNLKFVQLAHALGQKLEESVGLANLAEDYIKLGKDSIALVYYDSAVAIQSGSAFHKINYVITLRGRGSLYQMLKAYPRALADFQLSLKGAREIEDDEAVINAYIAIAELYEEQGLNAKATEYYLLAWGMLQTHNDSKIKANLYIDLARCFLKQKQLVTAGRYLDTALILSKTVQSESLESDYYETREVLDSVHGNWRDAYMNYKRHIRLRDKLFNDANTKQIMQVSMQYEYDKKQAELKAIQDKKDMRQRTIRNSIIFALAGSLLFLVVVYRQRNKIAKERERSDELLLNILPEEVAEELKDKGSADARYFNLVTVMFTDFKDFTRISEKLSPAELVSEIHTCYKAFDEIITRYTIEKIKTIGDSYMCAGGLPVSNSTHAIDVVRAALEIQRFMHKHAEERIHAGKEPFEIRIGIHTGPVVAGIVGVKKFAYDIWGDTVNLASRMESGGETGKVNISGSTYEFVKDHFSCTHRGKIQAKGKGEIDMYFVDKLAHAG